MRKTMTRMGLGLALVVGAAGAAAAQSTRPDNRADTAHAQKGDRGERGMRRGGPGGPNGALLKGITLTECAEDQGRGASQGAAVGDAEEPRAVRRGDEGSARRASARRHRHGAREEMAQVRAEMAKQRERQVASLRTILTAEQQKQLDANVTEWKERGRQSGHREHGGQGGQPRKSGATQ